jgi:opine dehydrogenase
LATVAELAQAGWEVRLWHRNPATLRPYQSGPISYQGALGTGEVTVKDVTTDLAAAMAGAAGAVISLPAFLHPQLFADLADLGCQVPVVLSPGQPGGALHFQNVFRRAGARGCAVAELSTLPYVCRVERQTVSVTGRAGHLRCGSLPGHEPAAKLAGDLFGSAVTFTDVLGSSLANVNLVLHPPGAVAAAAWVEATGGNFTFYVEAMTAGVGRVVDALDAERLGVAARYGHVLPSLTEEMALVGTVPSPSSGTRRTAEAIAAGGANRGIRAPGSLAHRYYKEDFAFGLAPFLALAATAGAEAPVAQSLLALGRLLAGEEMPPDLDAHALGISGLGRSALLKLVHG